MPPYKFCGDKDTQTHTDKHIHARLEAIMPYNKEYSKHTAVYVISFVIERKPADVWDERANDFPLSALWIVRCSLS